jgi:hypothetical protein
LAGDEQIEQILRKVSRQVQKNWVKLFPDRIYILREILKAETWLQNNPKRKPVSDRGMAQFLTNWLSRGWENYRKTQTSNGSRKTGAAALEEISNQHSLKDVN